MPALRPIACLPQALIDAGYQDPGVEFLIEAAQAGWISGEQDENGCWHFDPRYLRIIAESLMLEPVAA